MKNKTWKNHLVGGGIFAVLITLVLITDLIIWRNILISYFGNALLIVLPLILIAWFGSVYNDFFQGSSGEDPTAGVKDGIPTAENEAVETSDKNGERNWYHWLTDLLIVLILAGMVLDYIYNPHLEFHRTVFPTIGGVIAGTLIDKQIKKRKLQERGKLNYSVISFGLVVVVLLSLQLFAEYRSYGLDDTLEEYLNEEPYFFDQGTLPIGMYILGEDARLMETDIIESGQSFWVEAYGMHQETWREADDQEEKIWIRTYQGRNAWVANQIFKDYLNLRTERAVYFVDGWNEDEVLAEYWKVEEVWVGVGEPWMLIRNGKNLLVVEVFPSNYFLRE